MEQYDALIGQYIGKFKIDGFLRKESFAIVFAGHHESLERKVTIKLLVPSPSVEYFLRYCQKIVALEHENIASIYDIALDENLNQHYVIEQALDGQTLAEILEAEIRLEVTDAIKAMREIVHAMAYAHERDMVHGNLVPENMMRSSQDTWKVTGFALVPSYSLGNKIVLGTQGYMAPEQKLGCLPNFSTDVYQLGCLFYRMLTGKLAAPDFLRADQDSLYDHAKTAQRFNIDTARETGKRISAIGSEDRLQTKRRSHKILAETTSLPLVSSIPDEVGMCLNKMLAPEPKERFRSACELLSEIESLWLKFNQVLCPRCGKKNIPSEVFRCKKCNTENLCLSHIVPEEQCCDRCAAKQLTTLKYLIPRQDSWIKLSHLLRDIANNNRQGILVLGPKGRELGLHIVTDRLEVYSYLALPRTTGSDEDRHKELLYGYLLGFMKSPECIFEFWENDPIEKVLPNHPLKAVVAQPPGGLLISFSQVLRLFRDCCSFGGLSISTLKRTVAILFTGSGVFFGILSDQSDVWTVRNDPETLESLLTSLLDQTPLDLQYRLWPQITSQQLGPIPFSGTDFLQIFGFGKTWSEIGSLLPEMHILIPSTVRWDRPFGGLDLTQLYSQVMKNIAQCFSVDVVREITGFSTLESLLFIMAMVKERLSEISQHLMKTVQTHPELNAKNAELILAQAYRISPENLELCYFIAKFYEEHGSPSQAAEFLAKAGHLHSQVGNMGLALPDYEKAAAIFPQGLIPRLHLLELYEKLDQRENLRKVGLDLFVTLQQRSNLEQDESMLEKVCQMLLKVDSALVPCHNELIHIHLKRKEKAIAIYHYDELIKIYQRANNHDAMVKAMTGIISLEGTRTDIKKKLNEMGYDWHQLLERRTIKFLRRAWSFLAVLIILIVVMMFLGYQKIMAWNALQFLQTREIAPDTAQNVQAELWELAGKYPFADIQSEILKKIAEIQQMKQEWAVQDTKTKDSKFFQITQDTIALAKKLQKWPEINEICNKAQALFQTSEQQQQLVETQQEIQEPLKQWQTKMEAQAEQLLLKAQTLERKGDFYLAVDVYYDILDHPYLKQSSVAAKIRLPLVISSEPSFAPCFIGGKFVGRTPQIYRYDPNTFPNVQVQHAKYKKQDVFQLRTISQHIWKIHVIGK